MDRVSQTKRIIAVCGFKMRGPVVPIDKHADPVGNQDNSAYQKKKSQVYNIVQDPDEDRWFQLEPCVPVGNQKNIVYSLYSYPKIVTGSRIQICMGSRYEQGRYFQLGLMRFPLGARIVMDTKNNLRGIVYKIVVFIYMGSNQMWAGSSQLGTKTV